MTIEQELRLSYYQQVADIDTDHNISLVQDSRNDKFYVKKLLTVYHADIYRYLMAHPIANTPRILLAEEDGNTLTVIEEYIPGDTLEERLDREGVLPEEQVFRIIGQLCEILSSFHNCSPAIVNRDIKPSNLKITPDGILKLLDLNAAKWSGSSAERDTVLLGTEGYAAPEQYGFGSSTVLTDIYAVGVLMNVMLTGSLPCRHLAGGRAGEIIRKCVELSPAARYQSIGELQAALDADGTERERTCDRRRFLPPGFRNREPFLWLLSALGYALLLAVCFGLKVENAGATELMLNRITVSIASLCIVFFNGNYLNIQRIFSMTRSKHRGTRWLGILIVDAVILVLWVITLDVLVSVFAL